MPWVPLQFQVASTGLTTINPNNGIANLSLNQAGNADVIDVTTNGAGNGAILNVTTGSAKTNGVLLNYSDNSTTLANSYTYGFYANGSVAKDNYGFIGGYFNAGQTRTSQGSNADLAIGVDAYASSAITTAGTFGYAGRFTAESANVTPMLVKGASSQASDLFDIQNSSGAGLVAINNNGLVGIGTTGPAGLLQVGSGSGQSGYALNVTPSGGTAGATAFFQDMTADRFHQVRREGGRGRNSYGPDFELQISFGTAVVYFDRTNNDLSAPLFRLAMEEMVYCNRSIFSYAVTCVSLGLGKPTHVKQKIPGFLDMARVFWR